MYNPIEEITKRWEQDLSEIQNSISRIIAAINENTFTLDNPQVYETHDLEVFKATHPFWSTQKEFTLEGYIESYRAYRSHYTDYFLKLTNVDISYVDETSADCLVHYEASGAPPGIIRPGHGLMNFCKKGDKWVCTSMATLNGIELDDRCERAAWVL